MACFAGEVIGRQMEELTSKWAGREESRRLGCLRGAHGVQEGSDQIDVSLEGSLGAVGGWEFI